MLGTIAWRGRIDYELALLTGRRLDGIQPPVLAILRMGLFQLRFLDRVPQHAIVDTAVSIAKRIADARKASGFVNAVMRRATRERPAMPNRARDEIIRQRFDGLTSGGDPGARGKGEAGALRRRDRVEYGGYG